MTKAEKISALLAAVLIVVCVFAALKPSASGITSERNADTAEIMAGGDGDESTDELLPGDKVNINTADLEELCHLPGIGETIGQRIIDYRAENGSFTSADELDKVEGIGETTLENMREYIALEDDAP